MSDNSNDERPDDDFQVISPSQTRVRLNGQELWRGVLCRGVAWRAASGRDRGNSSMAISLTVRLYESVNLPSFVSRCLFYFLSFLSHSA